MSRLDAPCRQRRARHDSGPRRASEIRYIVAHSTEGGTAASVAAFFATTAQASTQLVVDDAGCYRCLPDLVVPWGAPGANTHGLHVEHCGFAHWTRAEWLAHRPTLDRSAYKAARWSYHYRIPRRWLKPADVAAGARGFCRHLDVSRAFHTPGGHTDPGHGFPCDVYMRLVQQHYAGLVRDAAKRDAT